MSLTPQQIEQRLDYVTGSDCAVILGVSPWGNIIELWQEKLRLKQREDISDKPAVKAGNYLEPVVCQWFSDETGIDLEIDLNFLISKKYPFMAGNIDRRVTGQKAIFEAKTSSRKDGWGECGENIIPDYYLCQVAHYVCIDEADRAFIGVLIGGNDFRHYSYERNSKLEDMIIKKETEFWNCVKTETPPVPRTANEVVSLYSQALIDDPLIASQEVEQYIMNLREVKEIIKEKEIEKDILEVKIKAYIKERDTLLDINGRVMATWKNAKGASRFDAKKFSSENKELYETYIRIGEPSRRFIVK